MKKPGDQKQTAETMKNREYYKIYLADIRPLYDEKLQQAVYDRLPPARQKKADRCKHTSAKAACLAVGFLAEYALKSAGYAECEIGYTDRGAPVVSGESVYISLSHSGDYAVCAVCDKPVGIDIQRPQKVRTGILKHFFDENQRKAFLEVYGCKPDEVYLNSAAQDAFLRQWTVKESYMKLTGQGMTMGFDRILIQKAQTDAGLTVKDRRAEFPDAAVKEYTEEGKYYLSVCIQNK